MTKEINNCETSVELKKSFRKSLRCFANSSSDFVAENVEQIEDDITRKFICTICKKSLSTKDTLRRHILSIHIKLKPFECGDCNKKFVLEKALSAHMKIHEDVPQYICHCGEKYKVESSYKDHIRRLHQAVPSTHFDCTNCDKIFYDRKSLRTHLNAVHKPKTIECSYSSCNKLFSTISLMHAHYRCHSEDCKICSECGQRFKSDTYLQKHKLTHDGVRPFSCHECCKTYLSISHLNQHRKRAHSTADKFQCVFCGKCFNTKEQLTYHENAHQGEKPFICDICGYQTAYRNTLYAHKKNLHSNSSISDNDDVVSNKSSVSVKLPYESPTASSEKITATISIHNKKFKKSSQKGLPTTDTVDHKLKDKVKKNKKLKTNTSVDKFSKDNHLAAVNSNECSTLLLDDSLLKSSPMNMYWDNDIYPDWVYPDQSPSELSFVINDESLLNQSANIFPKGRLSANITLNCTAVDCQSDLEEEIPVCTPFCDY